MKTIEVQLELSEADRKQLRTRAKQLVADGVITTPHHGAACAYVVPHQHRWWIMLVCPSGMTACLRVSYPTQASAEQAVDVLGFDLRRKPYRGIGRTFLPIETNH